MSIKFVREIGALVLLAACAMDAGADDKNEYNRRQRRAIWPCFSRSTTTRMAR